MRTDTVMKETLSYFEEELIGVVERLRFVANNIDDIRERDNCCEQVEQAINKLRALIRETDIKGESK
jgi:hypothetical protein